MSNIKVETSFDESGNVQLEIIELPIMRLNPSMPADLVNRVKAKLDNDSKAKPLIEPHISKASKNDNALLYAFIKHAMLDYLKFGLREIPTVVKKFTAWDRLDEHLVTTIARNRELLKSGHHYDDFEFEIITRTKLIRDMRINVQTVAKWLAHNRETIDNHHRELGIFDADPNFDEHSALASYARQRSEKLKRMSGNVSGKND